MFFCFFCILIISTRYTITQWCLIKGKQLIMFYWFWGAYNSIKLKYHISSEWLIGMFWKFDYFMLFFLSFFSLICQTKEWPKVCTSQAVESTWKMHSQDWFKMSRKQLVTHWYPFTPTHKHYRFKDISNCSLYRLEQISLQ